MKAKGLTPPRWFVLSLNSKSRLHGLFGRFGLDLGKLIFSMGGAFGQAGLTPGDTILLETGFPNRPYLHQLGLLAHEITHSVQYRRLGWSAFLRRYRREWKASAGDPYMKPGNPNWESLKENPVFQGRPRRFTVLFGPALRSDPHRCRDRHIVRRFSTTSGLFGAALLVYPAASTLIAACDPGWSYVVPNGRPVVADGLRYDLAGPSQTALRVYASLFTSKLTVELEITNAGGSPLTLAPAALSVLGRDGLPLPAYDRDEARVCLGRTNGTGPVSLPPGQSCRIASQFSVTPDPRQLRTLTVTLDSVTRDGRHIIISIPLEKG